MGCFHRSMAASADVCGSANTMLANARGCLPDTITMVDQKSTGLCPRRFESCRLRPCFAVYWIYDPKITTRGGDRTHNLTERASSSGYMLYYYGWAEHRHSTCTCTHVHVHVHVHMCTCACTCTRTCTCTCVHVHVHVYTIPAVTIAWKKRGCNPHPLPSSSLASRASCFLRCEKSRAEQERASVARA